MPFSKQFISVIVLGLLGSACGSYKKSSAIKPESSESKLSVKQNTTPLANQKKQREFDQFFFDGQKEKLAGNHINAVWNFSQATRISPGNAAAWYELASSHFYNRKLKDAEDAIVKAVALDVKNKWYKILQADIYQNQSEWAKAIRVYDELINMYPESRDYYYQLATLYTVINKPAEVIKTYNRLEKALGPDEQLSLNKHKVLFDEGEYKAALEIVNNLLKEKPSDKKILQLKAQTLYKLGKQDEAFKVYEKLEELYPGDPYTCLSLSEFYYKKGDKTKSSEKLLQAFTNPALSIDHKIQILYNNYLMRKMTDNMRTEAYNLCDAMVKAHPKESKGFAIYGDFLIGDNRKEEAREKYRKSIEFRKDIFSVWQQVLTINLELRDYKSLETESDKCIEYFPSQPVVYFYGGNARLELKKYKEAAETFRNGLNLNGNNKALENQLLIGLAEAYYRQDDVENSFSTFEKALELDSADNLLAMNNYAYYLSLKKMKLQRAEMLSKKTIDKEPDNSSYLDTYGWILFLNGNYEEAEKYIRKSIDTDKSSAEVHEHLGDVLSKLNRTEDALMYWKKAKEMGSDSKTLEKKINEKRFVE